MSVVVEVSKMKLRHWFDIGCLGYDLKRDKIFWCQEHFGNKSALDWNYGDNKYLLDEDWRWFIYCGLIFIKTDEDALLFKMNF